MSLEWFFYKKNIGWLGLECPACYNDRVFEGVYCQDHLLWKCAECGNYLALNLKKVAPLN